jgi:SPP1 family predicted phage head-tail adaptor
MRAGRMRWQVTIVRRTDELDEWDQPLDVWNDLRTVRGEKIHKAEDEKFAAAQRYEARLVTFRIYYTADIRATDRLRCDGLEYDIKGIRELGFRRGLEIAAEYRS